MGSDNRELNDSKLDHVDNVGKNTLLCRKCCFISHFILLTYEQLTSTVKNCAELHESSQTISGVYTIKPDHSDAFDVYCDETTEGGSRTVFQRRIDGSVDFNRTWADFKNVFGSFLAGEFWLGLDKIHLLTREKRNSMLRVDLGVDSKKSVYAEYEWFGIANETAKYQLNIGKLANLNGIYEDNGTGKIHWGKIDGNDANGAPKTSEMKIRPVELF
ncbi:fibroleukin-like [Stylophora pistillata]|uniref:fibroleukin-like n=1 Tax=Stylophora pistillata TaxID=50429 RepID=UPI000C04FD7F|nr:fibroleukin-like [Stylophora pistillata]